MNERFIAEPCQDGIRKLRDKPIPLFNIKRLRIIGLKTPSEICQLMDIIRSR
jgi:hypothetical protein